VVERSEKGEYKREFLIALSATVVHGLEWQKLSIWTFERKERKFCHPLIASSTQRSTKKAERDMV